MITRYRERIPELMAREHVPGLALAVVDERGVVWEESFGRTADDDSTPVDGDTLFSVQSMSKVFTATAVMQAVQAGRLDLDAPITTYLPDFRVHSAFEQHPERKITLRMLLSHTAGLADEAPVGNNYDGDAPAFDAHVRSISRTWLRFPVGTGYAYSNLGIDLAGRILEQVWGEPFPALMQDSLLGPLGMTHSTFDRTRVHAATDRARGHAGMAPPPVDLSMTAAGGLWSSATDLAKFLRFQLGNGVVDGRTVLDPTLMRVMRTVPAPDAGAPAGYALGVARTRWRVGPRPDLFSHGGGGFGFLSDLWWLPELHLGIAVLTNSSEHDLQGTLALGILRDLVTTPGSVYHRRLLGLPRQADVVEPDSHYVPPADIAQRIAATALPRTRAQADRWASYAGFYRTGRMGAMDPSLPPSRFRVDDGSAFYDAAEEGPTVSHRLTEFEPGLFLADDGETLDLRGPSLYWRGVSLHRVTDGPTTLQWALLYLVAAVSAWWLVGGTAAALRRRREGVAPRATGGGAVATGAVASVGAATALVVVAGLAMLPGLVDVGFLGRMPFPLWLRLALHLPLALVVLGTALLALEAAGALGHRERRRIPAREGLLVTGLVALAVQLALWHLVAWGF